MVRGVTPPKFSTRDSNGPVVVALCDCAQKSVADGHTTRECPTGLSSVFCIPTQNNHICGTDLCNASTRLHLDALLAAAILVLAAVVRNVR